MKKSVAEALLIPGIVHVSLCRYRECIGVASSRHMTAAATKL